MFEVDEKMTFVPVLFSDIEIEGMCDFYLPIVGEEDTKLAFIPLHRSANKLFLLAESSGLELTC